MTRLNRRPATVLRVIFGMVWLVDAFFKWQPGFRSSFTATIQGMVSSQPGVVRPWFQFWALIAAHTGHLLPDASAVTETALAVALIVGIARRPVYVMGALYAAFVWAVGEGFGGPYVLGTSTDVGAAVIYVFVFACLFMLDTRVEAGSVNFQRAAVLMGEARDTRLADGSRGETQFDPPAAASANR